METSSEGGQPVTVPHQVSVTSASEVEERIDHLLTASIWCTTLLCDPSHKAFLLS